LAERLEVSVEERALRQFVSILATQAEIMGVDLQGADTPLVQ
jgi:peptidyl-prolyl cis-trans isomerase C